MVTIAARAEAPKRISILGATGSIGRSALDVIRAGGDSFDVEIVTAHRNADELARIARLVGAKCAIVADPAALGDLRDALSDTDIEAAAGPSALVEAASRPVDIMIAAIVGAAGLAPTLAAIEAGSNIALANKECMVSAGHLFTAAARKAGVRLLPADSEHNAVFQVLDMNDPAAIDRIILTASGGPFRTWPVAKLTSVTPSQALKHPNWSMGQKISIDSSTMLNKGLELIEAYHLFGFGSDKLEVIVHPQSIVHGMVAYRDGSVLAQLSVPDMRVPIANCLWWPERKATPHRPLDLTELGTLTFEKPDADRFPALTLARDALERGGHATNILNAANEIAVEAFLASKIGYLDIAAVIADSLEAAESGSFGSAPASLEEALAMDAEGRRLASLAVGARAQRSAKGGVG